MAVFGIDISSWQKGYPYSRAKAEGVKFVMIRAGFSMTKDSQFETHYSNARKQGWNIGAYWYSYAESVAEANKEAQTFLKVIKGKKFEYPICLDLEDSSIRRLGKTKLNAIVNEYNKVIRGAGYYFMVYTNVDWYRNVISGTVLNRSYDWWIASWTKTKPSGINAGIWQFGGSSNAIRSPRIAGVVTDQDYSYKDYPSIMKSRGLNGYGKSSIIDKVKDKIKPKYTPGLYRTTTEVNVRAGAGTKYRIKKVKELTSDGKKNATSKNTSAYACYKKNTEFTAQKIIKEGNNYWAQTPSGYVCIQYGNNVYAKKI